MINNEIEGKTMARGGVTFIEVEKAAQYLQGLGKNPTIDAIREYLGTGSRTTLAEHLKRWKGLQGDNQGRLPQPLITLVTGLWDGLQSMAEQQVQEHQITTHQEITALKSQLNTAQQTETKLNQTLHQLQETCDALQREKTALITQLTNAEKSYGVLNASHQSTQQQLEQAKQENQRLHHLAKQIQTNLEHYQQAIQEQQLKQNLEKEKQHTIYAQEIAQLKAQLDTTNTVLKESEKSLLTTQLELQQQEKTHQELKDRHDKIAAEYQYKQHALLQLTAEFNLQKQQTEKTVLELLDERQAHNQLQQKMAVTSEQYQQVCNKLREAEDKIETLRQEKLFLTQEKAQMEGALRQLQTAKAAA